MRQITQHFQPPLLWQQFEDLTEAVLPMVYGAVTAEKIGRAGQAQDGVDVHLKRSRAGSVGVQCKRRDFTDENNDTLPGGAITQAMLKAEVDKARGFAPALDLWILATTAKRDARIQRFARKLDEANRKAGSFEVKLWFWDDYVAFLNSYSDVQRAYYADVIQLRDTREQDILILEVISTAFHRPALTDPLSIEAPDDMLQAIRDTQAALRHGELVDRQSRHLIRKALGGWRAVSDPVWQSKLGTVDETLSRVRKAVLSGIKDGRLQSKCGFFTNIDPLLGNEIARDRADCIRVLNEVLLDAGVPMI